MSRISESVDPAYAAACSDVTLCSSARGFFRGLTEELVALPTQEWLQSLEALPDGERLAAVMRHEEVTAALQEVWSRVAPLRRGKDARAAATRRAQAQTALQRGQHAAAIALASQAVLRAPPTGSDEAFEDGVSLSLALWTRAQALLARGCARSALQDLKLALRERLPARMRPQYYWQMGHGYRDAGEATRAKVSYELAARLLHDEDARAQLAADIAALDYNAKPEQPATRPGITVTAGAKQNMPALSKLVKIVEEENKGRFAVASERISTGDVVLVDSPYAACLLSDCYGTHCLHCFKRLEDCTEEAPIGCPTCSGIAFCSVQCRDTAMSTYHVHECPFLDLFIGSGMSILSYIALRMVTQAGLDTSLSIHSKYISNEVKTVEGAVLNDIEGQAAKKTKMKSRKERLNRAKKGLKTLNEKNVAEEEEDESKQENGTFEEKLELKASQVYSLCTHSEQRKGSDHLKRIVMAMFLTECLKKTDFFKNCEKENLSKAETSVCEMIARNLQLLQFNAHEIYETVCGQKTFSGAKPVYIAVGIYPTGALFNHECYPAVARYFDGRKLVLRATRPLAPGEVVSENYGPHFMMRSLKDRQRSLASRYWFRCACIACTEDWPTLKQMDRDMPLYLRCPNESCSWKFKGGAQNPPSRCTRCSHALGRDTVAAALETVAGCVAQYQEGAQLMDRDAGAAAAAALCAAVDRFHAAARAPHRETHLAQEALRSCFAADGNIHHITDTTDQSDSADLPTDTTVVTAGAK